MSLSAAKAKLLRVNGAVHWALLFVYHFVNVAPSNPVWHWYDRHKRAWIELCTSYGGDPDDDIFERPGRRRADQVSLSTPMMLLALTQQVSQFAGTGLVPFCSGVLGFLCTIWAACGASLTDSIAIGDARVAVRGGAIDVGDLCNALSWRYLCFKQFWCIIGKDWLPLHNSASLVHVLMFLARADAIGNRAANASVAKGNVLANAKASFAALGLTLLTLIAKTLDTALSPPTTCLLEAFANLLPPPTPCDKGVARMGSTKCVGAIGVS